MKKTFFTGLLALVVIAPLYALDVVQPPAPTEPAAPVVDPSKPLGELVGKLSALETLAPRDLADFATETIAYSQAVQGAKQQVSEKPIRDALAAVAQGRALDSKAADWDELQSRLEKFLEKPEQQKQDQQQQQKQDKKDDQKQDQQKDQQQQQQQDQQNQQNQSGDKNDQNQSQQDQQQKGDQQNQSGDGKDQQNDSQQPQQQDKQNEGKDGNMSEQHAKPQKESAFGDMRKKDGDKDDKQNDPSRQNADQLSQDQQRQQQVQQQSGEMQQIGGDEGKQQQPVDSRMIVPLQKLDQIRDKDSPAVLFQRMQATQGDKQQQPLPGQKPKGKNW